LKTPHHASNGLHEQLIPKITHRCAGPKICAINTPNSRAPNKILYTIWQAHTDTPSPRPKKVDPDPIRTQTTTNTDKYRQTVKKNTYSHSPICCHEKKLPLNQAGTELPSNHPAAKREQRSWLRFSRMREFQRCEKIKEFDEKSMNSGRLKQEMNH
jgi:hypothetical protein